MNSTPGSLTISPTGSIKTVAGFAGTANIGVPFWYGGGMTLINQGLISSEVLGTPVTVAPSGGITVSGTMQILNNAVLNLDSPGDATITSTGNATASHFRVAA